MSNRTLIEINHDLSGEIRRDPSKFAERVGRYLASASREDAGALRRYGVRVLGMRHHSEGFTIQWGSVTVGEKASTR